MKRQMNDTIGIDIEKDTVVIHRLPDKATLEVGNNKAGLTALLRWLGRYEALRVVFEPTGPYHRLLEKTLAAANIVMIMVNPRQARRFAEAIGRLAKTAGSMRQCWRGLGRHWIFKLFRLKAKLCTI